MTAINPASLRLRDKFDLQALVADDLQVMHFVSYNVLFSPQRTGLRDKKN
jgi:hypothetical protein